MRSEKHAGSHLNNFGAGKVTGYLGEYLYRQYDLADHRGESRYTVFDSISKSWARTVADHDLETAENLEQYMALLDKNEYEFAVLIYNDQEHILKRLKEVCPEIAEEMATDDLYVTVRQQRNATWRLSQKVLLEQGSGGISTIKVYSDKVEQTVAGADAVIIVVDKESGELVNIGKFSY